MPALVVVLVLASTGPAQGQMILDHNRHHLGIAGQPEWDDFASDQPVARVLKLGFVGTANPREATLLIRQSNVKLDWPVRLNGRLIGRLLPMDGAALAHLGCSGRIAPRWRNTLLIESPGQPDDILIDRVQLDELPIHEAVGQTALDIAVTDGATGDPLPCRITVTDPDGVLSPLWVEPGSRLALRPGVAYSPDGKARLKLRPGKVTVYASRGFEYGAASRAVTLTERQTQLIKLSLRREVLTPGLVACDTHVHTLTHSGHGDASIDERVITLAGEGVELPIATEHNFFADLSQAAVKQGVRSFFTPVAGDEVTTPKGHFNAFPFAIGGPVPDPRIPGWPDLVRAIRTASPVADAVVILNHPRDLHSGFRPFDPQEFNSVTGEHRRGPTGVDAIEVINSARSSRTRCAWCATGCRS